MYDWYAKKIVLLIIKGAGLVNNDSFVFSNLTLKTFDFILKLLSSLTYLIWLFTFSNKLQFLDVVLLPI